MKKSDILKMPTVGIVSFGLVGLEIKGFEFGIDDYILYVDWEGKAHRHKIKTNISTGEHYFISEVGRVYLSDVWKMMSIFPN